MTQALALAAAVVKAKYSKGCPKAVITRFPGMASIKTEESSPGDPIIVPVQVAAPQGSGSTIAIAQTNQNPADYKKFSVSTVEHFTIAKVKGSAMRKAESNDGAVVRLWTNEVDTAFVTETSNQETFLWGNGTGNLGQISASATVASLVLDLRVPSDAVKFALNMVVAANSDNTLNPTTRSGTAKITKIDRINGRLTTSGSNWSAQITSLNVNDYLCRSGDQAVSNAATVPFGVRAWVEGGTSPGSLGGLDRNTDPVGLAGTLLDVDGVPSHEAVQNGISTLAGLGAPPAKQLWCNPLDLGEMKKLLGTKVQYSRVDVKSRVAGVSFREIEVEGDSGTVVIRTSPYISRHEAFLGDFDNFRWESMGKAPMVLDLDSNRFLRVSNDDAYELRTGAYSQGVCELPFAFVRFSNFAKTA